MIAAQSNNKSNFVAEPVSVNENFLFTYLSYFHK